MLKRATILVLILITLAGGLTPGLAQDDTGTLAVRANGEDFVRQGFVSKDGWAITFDQALITLANITAYQTDPPYEAEMGDDLSAVETVELPDLTIVDLAEGEDDADPISVTQVDTAPPGRYNALAWEMINAPEDADFPGYTLVINGMATKDDAEIAFTLKIEAEYQYMCGEYVGDERLGILSAGKTTDLEMTFHFDHIFGDGDLPADDGLNEAALGFASLAVLAEDGELDVTLADLEAALSEDDFERLTHALNTLGHVGEGHCYEVLSGAGAE